MKTKTYKTYQARNAVKAAQVTNHIIAAKKLGESHSDAKAEAYRLFNIKKAIPILKKHFADSAPADSAPVDVFKALGLPPLPAPPSIKLPPLPTSVSAAKVAIISDRDPLN